MSGRVAAAAARRVAAVVDGLVETALAELPEDVTVRSEDGRLVIEGRGLRRRMLTDARGFLLVSFADGRTGPLPHPTFRSDYAVGGRVGARAGAEPETGTLR